MGVIYIFILKTVNIFIAIKSNTKHLDKIRLKQQTSEQKFMGKIKLLSTHKLLCWKFTGCLLGGYNFSALLLLNSRHPYLPLHTIGAVQWAHTTCSNETDGRLHDDTWHDNIFLRYRLLLICLYCIFIYVIFRLPILSLLLIV